MGDADDVRGGQAKDEALDPLEHNSQDPLSLCETIMKN